MRLAVIVLLVLGGAPALAQENPWSAGITPEQRERALRLIDAGNALFEKGHATQALAMYRQAVASWDFPRLRFNMAVALIELDQPLAAYEEIERALRFGEAAFEPGFHEYYEQALTYRKLLLGQLAQLRVECQEPDAQVLLDGEGLFVGPGSVSRVLAPGAHQLVASKAGHATTTRALSLIAGRVEVEVLDLQQVPLPRRTEQRWPGWVPWTVAGVGAAFLIAAIPIERDASKHYDSFDREVTGACPTRCREDRLDATIRDLKGTAQTENAIAISFFVGGGLVGAAGIAMILFNLPREVTVVPRPGGLAIGGRF